VLLLPVGLAALWGLWEGYRWLGIRGHWTWPFTVNDTNMPHVSTIWHAFGQPLQPDGPPLRHYLWHWSLFTGKEALAGFALGAVIGFVLAVLLAHSTVLRRGVLPYIVVSQTIPILAIAPMVVVGLGTKGVKPWVSVAVIAAYLTFFPVAINTLRGLHSPDPRALELMRSYAAGKGTTFRRVRIPASLPHMFAGLKIASVLSMIGAIVGEYFGGPTTALGVTILNASAYSNFTVAWAGIVLASAFGILFYGAVAAAERLTTSWDPSRRAFQTE
jgi:NitT/TauT family transport system permease protein